MRCTVPVNTGACLSPKDELAQEYLRIRHVQRIEIVRVNYSQAVVGRTFVLFVLQIAEHLFGVFFFSGVGNHRYLDFDGLVAEADLDNVADLHISGCLGNLVVYHNTSGVAGFICDGSSFDQS